MLDQKLNSEVPQHILDEYVEADKFFMIHENDPDLDPVRIYLPRPPDPKLIEGYGLPAKEQKFRRHQYPPRLIELEESVKDRLTSENNKNKAKTVTGQKILEGVLKVLNEKRDQYKKEIKWVQKEIYHLYYGLWVYIRGKPTYLDPWHYMYISYWNLDIGLPDYRDRDRRWFLFARYCYTTTENEHGEDLGFRTCYGFTYPKHRRDGATFKCLCIGYCIAMWAKSGLFGIQSFDNENAEEHFEKKLVPAWQKLPFFLKPMWSGSNKPATELAFFLPANKVIGDQLETTIDFATTASRSFYDGKKQIVHLSDENGKTLLENVMERHGVVKQTLSQGDGAIIHGLSMHPTTVAEMEKGGGLAFNQMCNGSKFYERNHLTGQTETGLLRIFLPAYDGLEGFIGPYGESIIENPTPEQIAFTGRSYGAKEHLLSRRDAYLKKGDSEAMREFRNYVQLFPMTYDDCFRMTGGDVGFDTEILDKRISQLRNLKPGDSLIDRGDFYWLINGQVLSAREFVDGHYATKNVDGKVIWKSDPNGNFEISKKLNPSLTNLKYTRQFKDVNGDVETAFYPQSGSNIVCSADPFQFLDPTLIKIKDNKDTMSEGGGAAFWKRDPDIDPDTKPIDEWDSCRFVCTYLNRPPLDDYYGEQMLMMCIYFNAYILPENNVKMILKYFISRGYRGYLMHLVNKVDGKIKDVAGFASLTESKQDLFEKTRKHIKLHGMRERHLPLLRQWKDIKNIKQMTNFDLLTAAGGCLIAAENPYDEMVHRTMADKRATININDIFQTYPMRRY